MRLLLDTNVIIPLEDSSAILEQSLSTIARIANEQGHQLLVHPSSLDDINRDTDVERRTISLSRVEKYPRLTNPPLPSEEDIERLGLAQRNDHDRVDNELLFSIYRDAANILITEDRGLHKKAERLSIADRVHYVQQAATFLERIHASREEVSLPNVLELPLHQIDLESEFFNSLRSDYSDFDDWFKEAAREGRTAWTVSDDEGNLGALAIFKEEDDPIVTNDNKALPGKVLKLSTFKVGENIRGQKIGELFLKCAFRYATSNGFENIYITMRAGKQDFLKDLCADFGFRYFGEYDQDEVFVKYQPINPPAEALPPLEYHIRYYPHFRCDETVKKFIVPIRPSFHEILFPDIQDQQNLFVSPAGNAIKQAYLCHARTGDISPGDILVFYRSRDDMALTTIGIVESVHDSEDPDKILELVSKRTVYSFEEIQRMAEKSTKVILFRTADHLPRVVTYEWLSEHTDIVGPIQTIRQISDEAFKEIVDESGIQNCFHAN